MNITTTINSVDNDQQTTSAGFRVDISRGERIGRVSSEWFSRPDDERYLIDGESTVTHSQVIDDAGS